MVPITYSTALDLRPRLPGETPTLADPPDPLLPMTHDTRNVPPPDAGGAFVPNREAVKAKSAKSFRAEQRRQARLQKTIVPV